MRPAKTAEPIEMPFGLWTQVGPRKHILDAVLIRRAKGQFLGERTCPGTLTTLYRELRKTAEPIDMPFALWARIG